jgi:hypothetical protein
MLLMVRGDQRAPTLISGVARSERLGLQGNMRRMIPSSRQQWGTVARDGTRLALFIDSANANATAKALGFDIDYKRLLTEFAAARWCARFITQPYLKTRNISIRPLIDWLAYNGFTVVTKPAKEFDDGEDAAVQRGMRVELAVDALEIANQVDNIMLFSGDGDFYSLLDRASGVTSPSFPVCGANTDDRRRIATPSGYFHRTRRSKAAIGRKLNTVPPRASKADRESRRCRAAGPEVR